MHSNIPSYAFTHRLLCVKQTVSGSFRIAQGARFGALMIRRSGRGGGVGRRKAKEAGMYVHVGLIHLVIHHKPTQCCKAIILQLKIN